MDAIILVGGQGSRLRPLTDTRPKPMMPLVDRPFVEHQMDHLVAFGVRRIVFSCGYLPDAIRAHFGDGADRGIAIEYVVDPEPLGTAGAIRNAEPALAADEVLVLNGDILTDLDLAALADQHRRTGAEATVALTPVTDPSAFGLVRLHPDRSVEAFVEKPSADQLRPGEPFRINAGTYLFRRRAIADIPVGRPVSVERETFPAIAGRGALFGHPSDAYWRDIGTPQSYLQAGLDVVSGAVRTRTVVGGPHIGAGALVAPGAHLDPDVVVGPGARIEEGAVIARSLIGAGARIGPRAEVRESIIGSGASIGADARVRAAVLGDRAAVGAGGDVDAMNVGTGESIAAQASAPA